MQVRKQILFLSIILVLFKNVEVLILLLGSFLFIDNKKMVNSPWNNGYMVKFNISNELKYTLIPYTQNSSKPGTWLLNSKEQDHFFAEIEEINSIIF